MFRPRPRHQPFDIPWSDYRFEAGPWAGGNRPWSHPRKRRGREIAGIVLGVLALVLAQQFRATRRRPGSWLRKAVLAAIVIAVGAAALSAQRRRGGWRF